MGGVGPLGSIEACELDNMFNTNVRGVMFCCREEARRMAAQTPLPTHDGREGSRGSIINIGSMLGYVGHENLCKRFAIGRPSKRRQATKSLQRHTLQPSRPLLA